MSGFPRAPRLRLASALFTCSGRRRRREILGVLLLFLLLGQPLLAQQQHVVQRGDTLYELAARYGTTVDALRLENGLSGTLLRVGQLLQLPGSAGFRFESAQAGETLAQIAARVGLSVEALQSANPELSGPLRAGTTVRVPPGEGLSLQLAEGDTLLALAIRFDVAPSKLLDANDLENLGAAVAGDWVYLPLAVDVELAADVASNDAARAVGGAGPEQPQPSFVSADLPRVVVEPEWHAQRQMALLSRAPALLADFVPGSSAFIMPIDGRLSSGFGWRNISVAGNRYHGGIDLAVDNGTPVAAAMDGVVTRAGWVGAYGYALYIDHGGGLQTRYAHLSELLVGVGETVRQGDIVARAGSTGASTGPHLHFEIRVAGQAVDPLTLLRR